MLQQLQESDKKAVQDRKNFGYDSTQKLTYFVVTAELALCGYMLLNADKLSKIYGSSYLFLCFGVAALSGIIWRFCYNITYHSHAHCDGDFDPRSKWFSSYRYKLASYFQPKLHDVYAVLTFGSFVWFLVSGFSYLANFF